MTLFHSLWTALSLVVFIGIWIWAFSRRRQEQFRDAAQLPLRDDEDEHHG